MKEVSVLVGGRAGDGINNAGAMVAQLLNHLGYFVYISIDYPSLIRGGHNFALVRAADEPVGATTTGSIILSRSTRRHSTCTCRTARTVP